MFRMRYMALAVGLVALTVFAAPAAADHFEPGSSKDCGALTLGGQVNCTLTIAISDDGGPGVIGGESIFVTLAAGTTGATYDSASLAGGTCAVGAGAGVNVNPSDLEVMPDSTVDIDDCTIILDEVLNADSAGEVCQTLDTAGNAPVLSFCDEIEPGPVGGCPTGDGWNLELVSEAIPELDNGNFADQNGDGWGCFKVNRGQSAKHGEESWTWKDNTNPLPDD
jgi:hypothetical protein